MTNKITLQELASSINAKLIGNKDLFVSDVSHDSRQASAETVFVAIKGLAMDGHKFIGDVIRRGATAIISEYDPPSGFAGNWLKVEDARRAMAAAAAAVHGNPSQKLNLVGITGTNGKTTTTYLVFALAEAAGDKPAMLTTVEYRIGEKSEPAIRTTPEATDTNRFLREALDSGCKVATMETSSQALHLHRCDGLAFHSAIFTNLTRDHLDYHLTMEAYFDAKKMLFDGRIGGAPKASIINIDDEWGLKLATELRSYGQEVVTFGIDSEADLKAGHIEVSLLKGTSFRLKTANGEFDIASPLVGKPHVYNILSAASAALSLGYSMDSIISGISSCVGAPGRFERVPHEGDFAVVVDYAHSDDALLNVLKTARELTTGKIITVFGCGGDRDKTKRAPMGEAAGRHSDFVVITSDNPRTEDPMQIIADAETGLTKANCPYLSIPDRREAIFTAIGKAETGDVVLIAGKGHETYQIIGNDKFHFDDREVAYEALEHRKEK